MSYIDDEVKKWKLDDEEREILEATEGGKLKSVPKVKREMARHRAYARYTLEKMRKSESISIRLSPVDLAAIKAKAAKEGLPYQTLIGSIIHKYAHGDCILGKNANGAMGTIVPPSQRVAPKNYPVARLGN